MLVTVCLFLIMLLRRRFGTVGMMHFEGTYFTNGFVQDAGRAGAQGTNGAEALHGVRHREAKK